MLIDDQDRPRVLDFGIARAVGDDHAAGDTTLSTGFAGCTLYGDRLYGFDESVLKCLDLDGKERWRKRGFGLGSLRVAGDRLLILTERGELVTARATAEGFEELARKPVFDDHGLYWSAPVLCAGRLYLRSGTERLICQDRR